MAIINKITNEYYKVFVERSYMMKDGIFCFSIHYKNKEEREKEKNREKEIIEFRDKFLEYIKSLPENDTDYINHCDNFINYLLSESSDALRSYAFDLDTREIQFRNKDYPLDMKLQKVLEELNFNNEWIENPVLITFKGVEYIGPFTHDDFTQSDFYEKIKKYYCEINGLQEGDVEFEDC